MAKEKGLPKTIGRAKAVSNHCRECMGSDYYRGRSEGTPPQKAAIMVRECSDTGCSLWNFRNGTDDRPERKKRAPKSGNTDMGSK